MLLQPQVALSLVDIAIEQKVLEEQFSEDMKIKLYRHVLLLLVVIVILLMLLDQISVVVLSITYRVYFLILMAVNQTVLRQIIHLF